MKSQFEVYLPFDLETTGLLRDNPAILEAAFCPFNQDLEDLKEFDSGIIKVYDNRIVTEGALKANGITREQITNGKDSQKVADELVKYLKSLANTPSKIVLCGQNSDEFDIPILIDFFEVHGYKLENYVNTSFTIDTMWWARVKHKESENYKLGTLCQNVGIDLVQAHRALADTRATKELVKSYISSLRGEGSSLNKKKRPIFQWR